jgi:hypothetical protein
MFLKKINSLKKKRFKCLILRKRKGKEKKNESVWLQGKKEKKGI